LKAFYTTTQLPYLSVLLSDNRIYNVNLITLAWTLDSAVYAGSSGVGDFIASEKFVGPFDTSPWGYYIAGNVDGTTHKPGVAVMSMMQQIPHIVSSSGHRN
jgi:hypothetical protein